MRLPDLRLNVAQLVMGEVGATRTHDLMKGDSLEGGQVRLVRVPAGLLASATVQVVHEPECSRCLRTFAKTEELGFEEMFYDVQPEDDPDAFAVQNAQTIDITEALRQYFLMAAEMQPLCKHDCPGLCPVCGKDLQEASCNCDRQPEDPRWHALAALRIDEG